MTIDPTRPGPAAEDRAGSALGWVLGRLRRVGPGGPERPPERMRILTIGGRAIRVAVREGAPGRPPLLLCNGIGVSLELFQPFVDALDPQRPVIRFDMPGIGGSPAPVVPYHLATLPSLLAGLLDQLGYEQADVLGISWGGGLAQQFALSRRDRVRRLVLVATGTGALMVPGHPRVLLRMLTPRRHRDPGYAAHVAGELYGGGAARSAKQLPVTGIQVVVQNVGGGDDPDRELEIADAAGVKGAHLEIVRVRCVKSHVRIDDQVIVRSEIFNDGVVRSEAIFVPVNLKPCPVVTAQREPIGSRCADRQCALHAQPPSALVAARHRIVVGPVAS